LRLHLKHKYLPLPIRNLSRNVFVNERLEAHTRWRIDISSELFSKLV
jgi:hypothetical protein